MSLERNGLKLITVLIHGAHSHIMWNILLRKDYVIIFHGFIYMCYFMNMVKITKMDQ